MKGRTTIPEASLTYNRTMLELKLQNVLLRNDFWEPYNRTMLELKLRRKLGKGIRRFTYNRTMLEL